MGRADVTNAEKYRRIMEAYQIENDYGRTIEAYRGHDRDGKDGGLPARGPRRARLPDARRRRGRRLGPGGLSSWSSLDSSYRTSIKEGLRIARKQSAPDMIRLPLAGRAERREGRAEMREGISFLVVASLWIVTLRPRRRAQRGRGGTAADLGGARSELARRAAEAGAIRAGPPSARRTARAKSRFKQSKADQAKLLGEAKATLVREDARSEQLEQRFQENETTAWRSSRRPCRAARHPGRALRRRASGGGRHRRQHRELARQRAAPGSSRLPLRRSGRASRCPGDRRIARAALVRAAARDDRAGQGRSLPRPGADAWTAGRTRSR